MPTEKLRILPLGGLGEIGMNCMVLEWRDALVLIDCGVQFPDVTYPGVDILVPDMRYIRDRLKNFLGVVVTHGHDDHIGAIPYLARYTDVDVYSTPFPRGLLENKLYEAEHVKEVRFHEIKPRKTFRLGPFTFDPIPVQHSIIESLAFAIETPVGTIIHSGDFKHDATEVGGKAIGFEAFEEYGRKGVLCLMSDSTNAERTGHTLSENDIANSFEKIFREQTGRLFIALFASNIRRVERMLQLAHRAGKKVAFAGRSMHSYTKLAHEQSSMNIPPDTLIMLEDTQSYADDRVLILMTGSQAEPQSALVRVAQGNHRDVKLKPGDKIIMSSRFIPGNERNITGMIDHLYRLGAEVMYESFHQIHVSGHGFQDELLMMLRAARPQFFVPIHGEYRHLAKHAKLARGVGVGEDNAVIIEDGQVLELDKTRVRLGEKVPIAKGLVVEGHFMEGSASLFTQRKNLAQTGIVFTVLMRDARTKKLVTYPRVSQYGLLFRAGEDAEDAMEDAIDMLEEYYPTVARREDVADAIRLELRRFFKHRVSHKPVVIPMVLDI